jgi:hypothetical protein
MLRTTRRMSRGLLAGLGILAYAGSAQACADGGCEMRWSLRNPHLSCAGRAVLSPGNDSRMNLLFLMADRAGKGPVSTPGPDISGYGYGKTFFEWSMLRAAFTPVRTGEDDRSSYIDASRCDSLAGGANAFKSALAASGIAADEQQQLVNARDRVQLACSSDQTLPDWPGSIASAKGQAFLAYLKAAEQFYTGDWDGSRAGFSALRGAKERWVAETATYMLARVDLNAGIAPALGDYGSFERDKVDNAAVTRAANALRVYFTAYPRGTYSASAGGLLRRTLWLTGNTQLLAREYARLLAAAPMGTESAAALVEEIDNKLLTQVEGAEGIEDPLLVATLNLMAMRNTDYDGDERDKSSMLSAAVLTSQQPVFASRPDLATLLSANHAYYVTGDMKRVLALVPDDARQASYGPVAFSRQYLRGMALAALKDRNEAGFWLELIGGAKLPWQRALVELALAMNYERDGKLGLVFAKDSPVRDTTIRSILLTNAAGAMLLRQQASDAALDKAERETALFTLLDKQLHRGLYSAFVNDLALLTSVPRNPEGENEYVAQPSLDSFREPKLSDGYPCATLAANARALAANPRDVKARLCLGDFWRLNGFDRAEEWHTAPQADELGGHAKAFAEPMLSRGQFYADIIADPAAAANNKAYALYRSVMCYAPSGINDCGGAEVAQSQRRAWFNQLKRTYPQSPWAQKLKAYW